MKLKNKNVLVYGLGKSGLGAIKLLKKLKSKIFVYDDIKENLENFCNDNIIKVYEINEDFLRKTDLIIVNPCVSQYCENLKLASLLKVKMISEIELAYLFSKGKIISVTGSNGKSTTSTLIYNMFKLANKKASLVGNIGYSYSEEVSKNKKQTYIVEVSSFQLETIDKYHSNCSAFLNFSENHLDRHFSLKNYFETKCRIFNRVKNKDFKILNYDDEKVKNIKFDKNYYYFSLNQKVKGAYFFNDNIYFNNGKTEEFILHKSSIKLMGEHNIQNVLCAIIVAKLYKIKNEIIKKAVESFFGIEHRIEFVENINGVNYYNDSKSTTVKATLTALNCFKNNSVILILGGSDKGFDFNDLFSNMPSYVKCIVAIGEVKERVLNNAKENGFYNVYLIDDFFNSIKFSKNLAESENYDTVLLSPATASYDMFTSFEQRGETFKNLVKELKGEN
ncbi:MAG: UDP-N-acetylmuramoyl-L-alanine--D-glutamate ligase [Clostridiales bacterium]|nr:UDP-N-acetylmuramoyl-L-alanine--D-glutamate ligase [Clostridiales bacterium]